MVQDSFDPFADYVTSGGVYKNVYANQTANTRLLNANPMRSTLVIKVVGGDILLGVGAPAQANNAFLLSPGEAYFTFTVRRSAPVNYINIATLAAAITVYILEGTLVRA